MDLCPYCGKKSYENGCCIQEVRRQRDEARARVVELERERGELRRVLCTLQPRLRETECECSDEGLCDKHLVEVTLANHPKR